MKSESFPRLIFVLAIFFASLPAFSCEYTATRYMSAQETACFDSLKKAEDWIRVESSPPRGNPYLEADKPTPGAYGSLVYNYRVKNRPLTGLFGEYFSGHPSGNRTACHDQTIPIAGVSDYGCTTEADMVAASMAAHPLNGNYTPVLRGGVFESASKCVECG